MCNLYYILILRHFKRQYEYAWGGSIGAVALWLRAHVTPDHVVSDHVHLESKKTKVLPDLTKIG